MLPCRDAGGRYFFQSVDLGAALSGEFDLLSCVLTGDGELDRLVAGWFGILGVGGALRCVLDNMLVCSLSVVDLLGWSLIGCLFCRNLLNDAGLAISLGGIRLGSGASIDEDYFGSGLSVALSLYGEEVRYFDYYVVSNNFMKSDKKIYLKCHDANYDEQMIS